MGVCNEGDPTLIVVPPNSAWSQTLPLRYKEKLEAAAGCLLRNNSYPFIIELVWMKYPVMITELVILINLIMASLPSYLW